MHFTVEKESQRSAARAGVLHTPHGEVATPIFMPVGTLGGVKCVTHRALREDTRAQIILGNTYHLFLRPGLSVLRRAGGLHGFSGWSSPLLTDSGGFQVYSLAGQRKLTELGVHFRSHIDGSPHLFTPERVINIERVIGADIIMPLDECPPGACDKRYAEESLRLTERWLARCWAQMARTKPLYGYEQSLFPIVQGGQYLELRSRAAQGVLQYDAAGYAIGGLAVGEPTEVMYSVLEHLEPQLPRNKPRYLMGVGTPANLLEAVARGVDMFDCVMPTRNARNGLLFTWEGTISIKSAKWKHHHGALDPLGTSFVDKEYSRAYLRHLFNAGEQLAQQIATLHNLAFYRALLAEARARIVAGSFEEWYPSLARQMMKRL